MILCTAAGGAGVSMLQGKRLTTWLECGFQRSLAGLEDFESAAPVGAAGEFQEDRVAAGRNLQSRWRVAVKFIVDENFGAVRIGGNGNCANAIGSGRRGGVCWLRESTGFGRCGLARDRRSDVGRRSHIGIKAAKNIKKIGGAESETDAVGIFSDEFQRVDADNLPASIEKWAATVAGIDGGIGLNPGSLAGVRKFSNGADDTLRDAEQHGIARIADGEHAFALANAGGVGESEVREINLRGWALHFGQGDIELRINVDDFGFHLLAAREQRKQ